MLSDCKFLSLFRAHNSITQMVSTIDFLYIYGFYGIKQWAMKLSAFDYKVHQFQSKCLCWLNASFFSTWWWNPMPTGWFGIEYWAWQCTITARVKQVTISGWPQFIEDGELQPYFQDYAVPSVEQGCMLWERMWLYLLHWAPPLYLICIVNMCVLFKRKQ